MANRDVEMRDRPPLPARVERLINPVDPVGEILSSIPGFHAEIKLTDNKDEAKFASLEKLIETTELLKSKYPQYDYSIKEVKARTARRQAIKIKITSEQEKYAAKVKKLQTDFDQNMRIWKRDQQLLNQLEQIDDNLLIMEKEIEETNKALNSQVYREERRQRLAAAREEREAAYAETLARQDARRGEAKRRRRNMSLPDLEPDEPVYEEYEEAPPYADGYSAAASA